MSKWKCGICNNEFDNYQAQGFNGIIYCPLCYFKELYKREKTKNDKAIEYINKKVTKREIQETRNIVNILYSLELNNHEFIELEDILKGDSNE